MFKVLFIKERRRKEMIKEFDSSATRFDNKEDLVKFYHAELTKDDYVKEKE